VIGFYQFINIQIFLLPGKPLPTPAAAAGDYWKAGVIKYLKFMQKSKNFY
jgi:hypothetical protein